MNKSQQTSKKGLIMLNIGGGKGKTTAAVGTAIRACGASMNVLILQFVKAKSAKKGQEAETGEWPLSCEIDFLNNIEIKSGSGMGVLENKQLGLGFVGILGDQKDKQLHIDAARDGLAQARQEMLSGKWQLIILDELVSAVELSLLTEDEVVGFLKDKPEELHLFLTGHNKYEKIIEMCDLVTNMKMEKHQYYQGVLAIRGIDY